MRAKCARRHATHRKPHTLQTRRPSQVLCPCASIYTSALVVSSSERINSYRYRNACCLRGFRHYGRVGHCSLKDPQALYISVSIYRSIIVVSSYARCVYIYRLNPIANVYYIVSLRNHQDAARAEQIPAGGPAEEMPAGGAEQIPEGEPRVAGCSEDGGVDGNDEDDGVSGGGVDDSGVSGGAGGGESDAQMSGFEGGGGNTPNVEGEGGAPPRDIIEGMTNTMGAGSDAPGHSAGGDEAFQVGLEEGLFRYAGAFGTE